MQPVVTATEMRALDTATITEVGIPAFTLMETAGRAVAASARAIAEVAPDVAGSAVAIDALFGIGALQPIDRQLTAVVAAMNHARLGLVVDIQRGLDADAGHYRGAVVRAQRTVTMAAPKIARVS